MRRPMPALRAFVARALLASAAMAVCAASAPSAAFAAPLAAEPGHQVSAATRSIELADLVWTLRDPEGKLGPAEVSALADKGAMRLVANPTVPALHVDRDPVLWLKLDARTDASVPAHWLLEIGRSPIQRVRIFTRDAAGGWAPSAEVGAALPFSARAFPHRNFVFPVSLNPQERLSILVRIADPGPTAVTATLWQPEAFGAADETTTTALNLYFGFVGGLLVYNLLLYLVIRERGYLLYVGSTGCLAVGLAVNKGYGSQLLWGDWVWWNSHGLAVSYSAAILLFAQLVRHFMSTRERMPPMDRAFAAVGAVAGACVVGGFVLPKNLPLAVLSADVIALSLPAIALSVIAVRRGWPGARYFCLAWVVLILAMLVSLAGTYGFLPRNGFTQNPVPIASALELILLSLALAARIKDERQRKERAQDLTLRVLQASRALNFETRIDKLQDSMAEAMRALTDAAQVRFVLWDSDLRGWYLYGSEDGGKRVPVEDAAGRGLFPMSALRAGEQSETPVLVEDVAADARFAGDPAFASVPRCSLLILPIAHHGMARAMLVLTKLHGDGGFAEETVDGLAAIAGPLAVALEDALLYERLEQRVAEQTRELRETQQKLVSAARSAGMAEIANGVLHDVGNTLNSVNVSAELIGAGLRASKSQGLARAVGLIDEHPQDLGRFLEHDAKGRLLPLYLRELSAALAHEREALLVHAADLQKSVGHIKNLVAKQQAHAGLSTFMESVRPVELVEQALWIANDSLGREKVAVVREFAEVGEVLLDRTRAVRILVNLLTNAAQALEGAADEARRVTVRMRTAGDRLLFEVEDRGCGILPEHMPQIFSHGFSARPGGHGIGLHNCAVAARDMGGHLTVRSEGAGRGASFSLDLPLAAA